MVARQPRCPSAPWARSSRSWLSPPSRCAANLLRGRAGGPLHSRGWPRSRPGSDLSRRFCCVLGQVIVVVAFATIMMMAAACGDDDSGGGGGEVYHVLAHRRLGGRHVRSRCEANPSTVSVGNWPGRWTRRLWCPSSRTTGRATATPLRARHAEAVVPGGRRGPATIPYTTSWPWWTGGHPPRREDFTVVNSSAACGRHTRSSG